MANLISRDNLFQDLFDFRGDFDQIFNRFLSWPSAQEGTTMTTAGFKEAKEADYLRREITYGSFQRSILLPEGVDTDKLNAEYRNGILEISAPISAAALPRKVEIKSLPGPAAKHATA